MPEWLSFNSGEKYLSSNNPSKDLMDLLVDKTRTAGHRLTFKEANSDPKMFRLYHYATYFVTFESAAEMAWQKVQSECSQSPDAPTTTTFMPQPVVRKELFSNPKSNFSTPNETDVKEGGTTKMPRRKKYDNSEVKAMLLNFYSAHGRFPRMSEATESNSLPSWSVLTSALGPRVSWDRLVEQPHTVEQSHATEPESVAVEPAIEPEPIQDEGPAAEEHIRIEDVEIDTSCCERQDDSVTIDLKITIPGREKPICISLTV